MSIHIFILLYENTIIFLKTFVRIIGVPRIIVSI